MSLLCKGMALPSKSIPTKKKEQPMGGTCEYAGDEVIEKTPFFCRLNMFLC